ncbi:MAG: dihydrolipoyllysine-residue acetyltransferase [Xanthomonadales bacterium]|nr:dihydrolipoyllysine-residue acetyltransferase [Xanthomonadales bacterium]
MSTMIEIKVPDIGDFSNIPVIEVLVSAGDRVKAEDSLVTLESDKATMEVPSPQAGVIREMRLKLNDKVSAGDVVAILEIEAQQEGAAQVPVRPEVQPELAPEIRPEIRPEARPEPGQEALSKAAIPQAVPANPAALASRLIAQGYAAVDPSLVPYASPSVRQFARELGADLKLVKGTGGGGRILQEDVTSFVKSVMTRPPVERSSPAGLELPPPPKVDFSQFGEISEQPLSRIQKLSAGYLHRNWISIPHVTQHDEADITDMEAFRKAQSADAEKQGFKLTPLVFLIKASVAALKKFPQFNASLDTSGKNLILKSYFNIGIAVDTSEGLLVPVLRECNRKSIMDLAKELAEVSIRAREQKLKLQDIQGGCFSISSLGGIGGTGFTPIINAPEVAVMGVSRSRMQAVWNGKSFEPRLMLPLSVSYDHRVIDGATAARFTRFLGSQLEDLRLLTL